MARATTKKAPAKAAVKKEPTPKVVAAKPAGGSTLIENDRKGKVLHDDKIKLRTFYASGSKGKWMVKRGGKYLERGYHAETIDGLCPYGPKRLRQLAVDDAYEWRKRIVLGPRRGPMIKRGKGE